MGNSDARILNNAALAERCSEATSQFRLQRERDDSFCFELVRRAVLVRDQDAWAAFVGQYDRQVRSWILRVQAVDEMALDDLAQNAFLRFFNSYSAELYARAESLSQVLQYLQDCARSSALDWNRRQRADIASEALDDDNERVPTGIQQPPSPDGFVETSDLRRRLWAAVLRHCDGELDILIAHRVLVEDVPPRQIVQEHPHHFNNVTQIYQRLRNLKDRLRRDQEVQDLWREGV